MSRKRSVPAYEYHISGQATARFYTASGARTAIYFGLHGTPQSWAKYHALCEQYKNNGFVLPEDQPMLDRHQDSLMLVRHITAAYRQHIVTWYAQREREISRLTNLCNDLDSFFGNLCVEEFVPLKLEELRNVFLQREWTRKYINRMIRETLRVFRHAARRTQANTKAVGVGAERRRTPGTVRRPAVVSRVVPASAATHPERAPRRTSRIAGG